MKCSGVFHFMRWPPDMSIHDASNSTHLFYIVRISYCVRALICSFGSSSISILLAPFRPAQSRAIATHPIYYTASRCMTFTLSCDHFITSRPLTPSTRKAIHHVPSTRVTVRAHIIHARDRGKELVLNQNTFDHIEDFRLLRVHRSSPMRI
jgi:hypothetical protein